MRPGGHPSDLAAGRHIRDHDGSHPHHRSGTDREVVADHCGHPQERVGFDPHVAGYVRTRAERDEQADLGVVSDQRPAAEYAVLADPRVGANDDARRQYSTRADRGTRGQVRARVYERYRPPAGLSTRATISRRLGSPVPMMTASAFRDR